MIKIGDKYASRILVGGVDAEVVYIGGELVWLNGPDTFIYTSNAVAFLPSHAVFIDAVLIGGGASGQTGNGATNQDGKGGESGWWASQTFERGVDIPWSTNRLDVVIGAGGPTANDSDHAHPKPGEATTLAIGGVIKLTAEGGYDARWNDNGGGQPNLRQGEDPSIYIHNDVEYYGGIGGRSKDTPATAPGAGGYGGGGGFLGSRSRGLPGAKGRAWITYRSY